MEKKMETTGIIRVVCYVGIIGGLLGVYWENGKENGNYRDYKGCMLCRYYRGFVWGILGLYWHNGKENGNYYSNCLGFRVQSLGSRVGGSGFRVSG